MRSVKKDFLRKYANIHSWLKRNYGKANKCESKKCSRKSNIFNWCLINGKSYEKNRDNFIMLCKPCHCVYDLYRINKGVFQREKLHTKIALVVELDDEMHQQIKEKAIKSKKPMREILLGLLKKWLGIK
ncbi:MAG: hypothetical protein AAB815_00745 [Patescibacteria group bacterium]